MYKLKRFNYIRNIRIRNVYNLSLLLSANKNFGIAYDKVREQIFKLEKTKIDVI